MFKSHRETIEMNSKSNAGLEELASHWVPRMTWLSFFTNAVVVVTLRVVRALFVRCSIALCDYRTLFISRTRARSV